MKRKRILIAVCIGMVGVLAVGILSAYYICQSKVEDQLPPAEDNLEERYTDAQGVVDFLSQDAIQKCLEHHVFEDPCRWGDWEVNPFQLPFGYDQVRYYSSSVECYLLPDDYYIFISTPQHVWAEGERYITGIEFERMSIVNEVSGEYVWVSPETFPNILKLLTE